MPTDESQDLTREDERTALLADVSNAVVGVYKDFFGRGPTTARTRWCGDDTLICLLEDTLTPAERSMARMGEHQRLRDQRTYFQYATMREFCEPVEQISGRKVRAFISGIDTEVEGMSIETFVLHPAGYEGGSRIERAVS